MTEIPARFTILFATYPILWKLPVTGFAGCLKRLFVVYILDNKKSPESRRLLLLSENIKILFLLLVSS